MSCLREAQLHDVHAGKDERVSKLLANFADDLVPLAACERFFPKMFRAAGAIIIIDRVCYCS